MTKRVIRSAQTSRESCNCAHRADAFTEETTFRKHTENTSRSQIAGEAPIGPQANRTLLCERRQHAAAHVRGNCEQARCLRCCQGEARRVLHLTTKSLEKRFTHRAITAIGRVGIGVHAERREQASCHAEHRERRLKTSEPACAKGVVCGGETRREPLWNTVLANGAEGSSFVVHLRALSVSMPPC